jgi:hypothetical protein
MSTSPKVLVPSKLLEAAQTSQYTASGVKARIDSCVATNQLSTNQTLSLNIVTSGDTPGSDNLFIKSRTIFPGESYECPEIIGQWLAQGDFVSTATSDGTAFAFRMSGIEVS